MVYYFSTLSNKQINFKYINKDGIVKINSNDTTIFDVSIGNYKLMIEDKVVKTDIELQLGAVYVVMIDNHNESNSVSYFLFNKRNF